MAHSSAEDERRTPGRSGGRGARVTVAILLGLAIVLPLLVFVYDSEKPALWGFPFYFWFQFLLIPVVSLMTFASYRLTEGLERRERTEHGLPEPSERTEDGR